ncbi:formylglycine-generating enzyme family protein [Prosthecobacter sp.]|jgi:formylglycine-generating enzyme required for sulfatase activity|uniref:formylglycine-generating enzyme family protein n=1 Tax=Prosthecobacter sp. TaxID=1965333 RepID=UPI00378353B9
MRTPAPFTSTVLLFAALFLSWAVRGDDSVMPPEAQKRLDSLKAGYESYVLQNVTKPFDDGLKALNEKVKPALQRASAEAAQRKDLDALVRIKADIERTNAGGMLTDSSDTPPELLKHIYATYKLELGKLDSAKKTSLADAKQRYDKGLTQIQDELTTAQKVEGALLVKQMRESLAAGTDTPPTASAALPIIKAGAYTNSLGMKFVPVPGTSILMCIHETRRSDFASYANAVTDVSPNWKNVSFEGVSFSTDENEPVTMVTWDEAAEFCDWLTKKDGRKHRLPTDAEWSAAIGIAGNESKTGTPVAKHMSAAKVFPWGAMQIPPNGFGNYADTAFNAKFPTHFFIKGYSDGFATTAPAMKFQANNLGIYDLGGNVWEWCADWFDDAKERRVSRGGSWYGYEADDMLSGFRGALPPTHRRAYYGFRCVVETN